MDKEIFESQQAAQRIRSHEASEQNADNFNYKKIQRQKLQEKQVFEGQTNECEEGLTHQTQPKNDNGEQKNQGGKERKYKFIMTGLAFSIALFGMTALSLGICWGVSSSHASQYKADLENVYESNFYSLVDSVNNLDTKLAKTIASTGSEFQRKTLLEASKNASEAEIAVASLPLSQKDIQDTVRLVNQISGYTSTLADNIAKGGSLSEDDLGSLGEVRQSVLALKNQLNEFSRKIDGGYSILDASLDVDSEGNEFSRSLTALKNNDIEYPTMIYDGPFSDSVVSSEVKGLSGEKVTKTQAMQDVQKYFKAAADTNYEGETNGRFETYNFRVTNPHDEMLYVQVTKKAGHILTISGAGKEGQLTIDEEKAKQISLDFAKENGIEDAIVVWSDTIKNDIYLNIAPRQNGIVLYPDLVKVKVNMVSGTIVGYDATSYFTNHVDRTLSKGSLSQSDARGKVPSEYEILFSRTVLSPLDYNREVVCVEVAAKSEGNEYYFYFNAQSGELENVLKVIKTDNGNLLM